MKFRRYLALSIAVLLAVFALQNFNVLTVRFFAWSFQIPQALLIAFSGLLGLLVGWLFGATRPSSK